MKSVLYFAAFACFALTVQAEEYYVGATIAPSYRGTLNTKSGEQILSTESRAATPFKALIGVDITSNFGLEAGYKTFGTTRTDVGDAAGTALDTDARAFYIAAKGMLPVNEKWTFTGKVGLAQRHFGITHYKNGQSVSESSDQGTLYYGVGVDYKLTKNLALTAELENFGTARVQGFSLGMNGFSVGVRYGF